MNRSSLVLDVENGVKRAAVGGEDAGTPSPLSIVSPESAAAAKMGAAESVLEILYNKSEFEDSAFAGMDTVSGLTRFCFWEDPAETVTSSLTSESDSTSTSRSHELEDYFRNYLYAPGARNENVDVLDSLAQSNSELYEKLKEISDRDLTRVNLTSANFSRASLICYKNGFVNETFKEIKIEPQSFGVEEMKLAKQEILEMEMEGAHYSVGERLDEIYQELKTYSSSYFLRLENRIEDLKKEWDLLGWIVVSAERDLMESVKQENLKRVHRKLKMLAPELDDNLNQMSLEASVNLLKEKRAERCKELLPHRYKASRFSNDLNEIISSLKRIQENTGNEIQILSSNSRLNEYQRLVAESGKCIALLCKDKAKLKEVVFGMQRGHIEDYMFHTLKKYRENRFLSGEVEKKKQEARVDNFDRFYLVISSTNDFCNRCSVVLESIHELITEELNPANNFEIKCKVLYFANKPQ